MDFSRRQLARLAHADAAQDLSERLVGLAATYADDYGRGAYLTEEAAGVVSQAQDFLAAAVIADRMRGGSWSDVGEALGISKQSAHERYAAAERQFRESVLFPHRHPEGTALGYTVAPYAVYEPELVRQRLDQWVVEQRSSSGPERDEPEPVTRGLRTERAERTWILDRMGQVTELADMLIKDELPRHVTRAEAERRLAELKVELYERMLLEDPASEDATVQLAKARARLDELVAEAPVG